MDEIRTEAAPLSDTLKPQRRAIATYFDDLAKTRSLSDAGGVPVPQDWTCFRAVLGGARREDLEDAYKTKRHFRSAEDESRSALGRVESAAKEGTHLPPGLHILTGQTGGGKSALVVNLARAAAKGAHPVLYVSLELDGEEIAARVLSLESAEVPWFKLALHKPLTADERRARDGARAMLGDSEDNAAARITVLVPDGVIEMSVLQREALDLWREHGRVPLVIFDYLQLAAVRTPDSYRAPLREAITSIVFALRALSRHTEEVPDWPGCPVVVLSTTARSNVRGDDAASGMSGKNPDEIRFADLETLKALPKEAGEVEATAVTAWVLALGERATANGVREMTMRLVKNRLGMPGQWIPFEFHGATGRLAEATDRYARTETTDVDSMLADQLAPKGKGRRA